MDSTVIAREVGDHVLLVQLNRPGKLNAIDLSVAVGLASAMDQLDARGDLRVGVITGTGGKFSAGADLDAFERGERPWAGGRGFAGIVERPSVKPLIAAVEGFAVGGGMEIVLSCDMVVAARGARFSLPETKIGLAAAGGGLLRMGRLPVQTAMEIALTGDFISAERLHELGVVNVLVEQGNAMDAALELAGRLAVNAPLAMMATKRVLLESADWTLEERWDRQAEITTPLTESEDAKEGARAFLERRAPQWRNR